MSRLATVIERELPLLRLQEPNLGNVAVLATKGRSRISDPATPPCFKEFIDLTECITLKGSKCCMIEYTNFLQCLSKHGFFESKS
jgi:hypothetical protein